MPPPIRLQVLRAHLAALESVREGPAQVLPFGDRRLDDLFPGGGLPLGRWHELAGAPGPEAEFAAASAGFLASLIRPLAQRGAIVWIARRDDLFAHGLASLGFPADRLILVRTPSRTEGLSALEDALGAAGVAAAVAEAEEIDLTAGRRLQLACEAHGATGFLLRRQMGARRPSVSGSAAASRWRVASAPSHPPPGEPGLGPPCWRLDLERSRWGRTGSWLVEKSDGAFPLRVVAELGDPGVATPAPVRKAG